MLLTLKARILNMVERTRLEGKNSERMMFSNYKERDGSEHMMMTRTLFTLKHLDPCRVRMSEM